MRNTGKPSETNFLKFWKRYGKKAHVFRFTDASEATGLNRRVTVIKAQPSDWLITCNGRTWYAETKSTTDTKKFSFSLLRKTQSAFAKMILAAGGEYIVYVHRLATDQWYAVPYAQIDFLREAGKGSMSWDDLSPFEWSPDLDA
jgi:hypothetical protein